MRVYQYQVQKKDKHHHERVDTRVNESAEPIVTCWEAVEQIVNDQRCVGQKYELLQEPDFLSLKFHYLKPKQEEIDPTRKKEYETHELFVFEKCEIWLLISHLSVHDIRH